MMYVKSLCLILSVYIVHVSSHENAYPPGIPPPNSQQQAHQHQAQQGYPNQGQGHPNQGQQQGHLNQGQQQGHLNQGQQGQLNQGQQAHLNQGQQEHLNQGQQGQLNQGQQGQNLQFQAGQQQNLQATGHYEDVNVQNMQQQQQGAPPGGHGGRGHHSGGFRQKEQVHNADHIKEHLKEVIDKPKEEMTEEELEFHYFKLHDYDANNKLDGTEITKAITHFHDDHENASPEDQAANKKVFSDEELSNIVEMVLKEDDLDKDGYITYAEFVKAQRKAQTPDTTQP